MYYKRSLVFISFHLLFTLFYYNFLETDSGRRVSRLVLRLVGSQRSEAQKGEQQNRQRGELPICFFLFFFFFFILIFFSFPFLFLFSKLTNAGFSQYIRHFKKSRRGAHSKGKHFNLKNYLQMGSLSYQYNPTFCYLCRFKLLQITDHEVVLSPSFTLANHINIRPMKIRVCRVLRYQ